MLNGQGSSSNSSLNELQRRAYLEALDLPVFAPKHLPPGALLEDFLALPEGWRSWFDGSGANSPADQVVPALAEASASKLTRDEPLSSSGSELFSTSGSELFSTSGSDLLSTSGSELLSTSGSDLLASIAGRPDARGASKAQLKESASELSEHSAPHDEPASEPPLSFTLSCWRYSDFLIFDEFDPRSAYPVPRLLTNILSALVGKPVRLTATQSLRWPVVKAASRAASGIDAARTMLATMLLPELERSPVNTMILCGDVSRKLFLRESQERGAEVVESFSSLARAELIELPALSQVLKEPGLKQQIQDALFV